jgi:hypothetical protein
MGDLPSIFGRVRNKDQIFRESRISLELLQRVQTPSA